MTASDLIAFEDDIAELFNQGKIRAPIHLYNGNEQQMIDVFKDVAPDDWVCCSWRSHYQCLLKGVPPDVLRKAILDGRSIALCFPEYRIISSAIVGGILPIAIGIALGIRLSGDIKTNVHCFLGDMTAETGIAHECIKYARNHMLPIRFIVEDNGLSTFTPTGKSWNSLTPAYLNTEGNPFIKYYKYKSRWPHSGSGQFVKF